MIRNVNWIQVVERKMSLLLQNLLFLGSTPDLFERIVGHRIVYNCNRYIDGYIFIDPIDIKNISQQLESIYNKDNDIYKKIAEVCYKKCEDLIMKASEIGKLRELNRFSGDEFLSIWDEYIQKTLELLPFLPIAIIVERLFEDVLKKKFKVELNISDDEVLLKTLADLVIPIKENEINRELKNILLISAQIQADDRLVKIFANEDCETLLEDLSTYRVDLHEQISAHVSEFGWIHLHGYLGEKVKTQEFLSRVKRILKFDCKQMIKSREDRANHEFFKYKSFIDSYKISEELRRYIDISREYIYLRMYRWDALSISHYFMFDFYREMANRLNLTYEQVLFMKYDEIQIGLRKRVIPEQNELNSRIRAYGYQYIDRKDELLTNQMLECEIKAIREKVKNDFKELSGQTACTGSWIGEVKIIKSVDDIDKMNEGDVLVSPMTTPDLTIAIEKAGAIITDEGGLLCHAAIVSRELGIPCIIGTKVASIVLKDMNIVEVNAEKTRGKIYIRK